MTKQTFSNDIYGDLSREQQLKEYNQSKNAIKKTDIQLKNHQDIGTDSSLLLYFRQRLLMKIKMIKLYLLEEVVHQEQSSPVK